MKQAFITKNFRWETEAIIQQAEEIIEEYQDVGMTLTLRQLYYQFVSRDLLANKQKEYSRLGRILSDAREAGLIDWDAIEDRTRNLVSYYYNTDPGDAVNDALYHFKLDKWENQPYRIEVWIEKEALTGVIDTICRELDIPYFACKGYVSKSEMYSSAKRMKKYRDMKIEPIIIHLGDHDPSGIDMTRDIQDQHKIFGGSFNIKRIALNMDQIEQYNPPPNPTKMTDSRSTGYVTNFGKSCWELDALEPKIIQKLIENTVLKYRDSDIYIEVLKQEAEYRNVLKHVAKNWKEL